MPDVDPVALVVPAFNEELRLDLDRLRALAADPRVRLVFVDDGSTDRTLSMLRSLTRDAPGTAVLSLGRNRGKAEAVRHGLQHAVAEGAGIVGYYDIDLATPPDQMLRLIEILVDRPDLSAVLGARVSLLGSAIDRSPARHYAGRVFASFASVACGLRVYDTQCGAKLFRVTPALKEALGEPFRSRWCFDVELLSRLTDDGVPADILEVPLSAWSDVAGSKLSVGAMLRAPAELAMIWRSRLAGRRTAAVRMHP